MSSLPSTIKAIGLHKTGDFNVIEELNDIPLPTLKEDEVLVKVEYAGVNYYDTYVRSGAAPTASFPKVFGAEASGTIVALPTSNSVLDDAEYKLAGLNIGDKVVGSFPRPGSYAQYVALPWSKVAKIPSGVDTKAAAAIFVQGLTALVLSKGAHELKKGDTALIYAAAGGVGIILSQIALNVGATVIGTVSTEEKAKVVRDLGVQHVIVTSKQDTVDEVLKITNGEGVQVIYDGIGKETSEDNLGVIAQNGTILVYGATTGRAPAVTPEQLAPKNLKYLTPGFAAYIATPKAHRAYSEDLFSLLEKGVVKPIIHAEYPFTAEGVQQSQKDITSRGTIGKLLIKVE